MRKLAIILVISLAACAHTPDGRIAREGMMTDKGTIEPCGGNHTDTQACGNAIFNAPLLQKVHSGMSMAEVRQLMQHDAERREISANTETWIYMSDYDGEKMTAIIFTDGKVTGMKQIPWKTE
jgi:hypothetical protein